MNQNDVKTANQLLHYLRGYSEIKTYAKLERVIENIEKFSSSENCTFTYYALLKKIPIFKMRIYALNRIITIFKTNLFEVPLKIQKHNSSLNIKAKHIQRKRKFQRSFHTAKGGPKLASSAQLSHGRGLSAPMQF